jgi:hypothetical protein
VTAHQQFSSIIRNQAKLMSVPETVPAVEVRRLLEENARLRSLLIAPEAWDNHSGAANRFVSQPLSRL